LRPRGRIGLAFGSYGWSGEATKLIEAELEAMKVELIEEGLKARFVPTEDDLRRALQVGKKTGEIIKLDNK